jgi:ketosteroid isomerase-like protein
MRFFFKYLKMECKMDIRNVIDQYHAAADEFSKGNPLPVKMIFSHRDDVTLANPFGPPVLGWSKVSDALDFASSRFKDGEVIGFLTMAKYETSELVMIFEIEKWKAKVSGREEVSSFDLRVTSTFRNEDGDWKLVHRHADPIAIFDPDGPLRGAG